MGKKRDVVVLYLSIGSFLLMSVSFLLMPIDFAAIGLPIVDVLIGIMFWVFLLLGIVTQIVLGQMRKKRVAANQTRRTQLSGKIGLLSFMQNLPACIADGAFVFSVIGLIVSAVLTSASGYACYVFTALTVYSFCMHCILNGKTYRFLANRDKVLKVSQPKHLDGEEKE